MGRSHPFSNTGLKITIIISPYLMPSFSFTLEFCNGEWVRKEQNNGYTRSLKCLHMHNHFKAIPVTSTGKTGGWTEGQKSCINIVHQCWCATKLMTHELNQMNVATDGTSFKVQQCRCWKLMLCSLLIFHSQISDSTSVLRHCWLVNRRASSLQQVACWFVRNETKISTFELTRTETKTEIIS